VNPETLRRWDNKGQLKAYRTPGGYRRFLAADIAAILKQREDD
jgi:DNA-binding transcriptional MerR regulator